MGMLKILSLLRGVHKGGSGAPDKGIGSLRSLVYQYMATNAVVLSFNDEFMDLFGDGGQLVKDFSSTRCKG